jgi:hypothetical protein
MNAESSETGAKGAGPSNGLIYNDELMESLASIILLGSKPSAKSIETLPHMKKMLYDYDIYMLSFLSDEDIEELAKKIKEEGINGTTVTDKKLKEKITAIRDNARVFVKIASTFNSVRAYIDKTCSKGDSGIEILEETFTGAGSEYKLKLVGAAACKKFLKQL